MKKLLCLVSVGILVVSLQPSFAGRNQAEKARAKRAKIDQVARETLNRLFEEDAKAKRLYDRSYGYAVFDNTKVTFGISGGGGRGVAVEKATNSRTYMRMGTAGLALGLGAQVYQVVFLFQDEETFRNFVDKGWEAEAAANAVAGTAGANAEASFRNGLAVYQLTEAGLMLQADISGTKYWKSKRLNQE